MRLKAEAGRKGKRAWPSSAWCRIRLAHETSFPQWAHRRDAFASFFAFLKGTVCQGPSVASGTTFLLRRQGRLTSMGGFTAINTSSIYAPVMVNDLAPNELDDPTLPRTVVSEYLGRGGDGKLAPIMARSAAGTKKNGGSRKKRAMTTGTASRSKRHKSGDVADRMPLCKANILAEETVNAKPRPDGPPDTGGSGGKSAILEMPSVGKSYAHLRSGDEFPESMVRLAMFKSPTSMTSIQSVGRATSLESLKATGCNNVYTSSSLSGPRAHGVEYSHPWLNAASAQHDRRGLDPRHTRVARQLPPSMSMMARESPTNRR